MNILIIGILKQSKQASKSQNISNLDLPFHKIGDVEYCGIIIIYGVLIFVF